MTDKLCRTVCIVRFEKIQLKVQIVRAMPFMAGNIVV